MYTHTQACCPEFEHRLKNTYTQGKQTCVFCLYLKCRWSWQSEKKQEESRDPGVCG